MRNDSIRRPATLDEWESRRDSLREALWQHLGDVPPVFTPTATITQRIPRSGYTVEKIEFDNGTGATVYGYLLLPDNLDAPSPAVLYHHAHGGQYFIGKDEIFNDRITGRPSAMGLLASGYIVFAIDAYAFGQRQQQGPAGARESGSETELSLFKQFLWQGSTLWGMMVRDDMLALNYLLSRSEVDAARVGTTGMSLGGSRATWLAALDDRISVAIPVAQMTRYRDFLATGDLFRHGIYYYIPAILRSEMDMEILVALTAPRPQRIIIGDSDPLSPIEGVHTIDEYARHVYALYDASSQFETRIYPGVAHGYTDTMYRDMLAWFAHYL